MAITVNDAIDKFGTQEEVTVLGSPVPPAVSNGAFSTAASVNQWTNTDDAPGAVFVGKFNYSSAPTANGTVELYARLLNIQSTNDMTAPDSNFQQVFLGSFPLNDATGNQYSVLEADLLNTKSNQVYEFYLYNNAGQTLSSSWQLWVTPKTVGPA